MLNVLYQDAVTVLLTHFCSKFRYPPACSLVIVDAGTLLAEDISRLLDTCFSVREKEAWHDSWKPAHFLAKRMAAKMAFFESHAEAPEIPANQLEIAHDALGCPYYVYNHQRLDYALSLSDEGQLVAAFCCKS